MEFGCYFMWISLACHAHHRQQASHSLPSNPLHTLLAVPCPPSTVPAATGSSAAPCHRPRARPHPQPSDLSWTVAMLAAQWSTNSPGEEPWPVATAIGCACWVATWGEDGLFEGPSGLLIAPSLQARFGVLLAQYVFVASQHGRILDFMRWDLAKCEKTLMFAQNLDPQCSSQASEKHCQGETSEKNDIRLAPLIRSFVISFRGKKYSMLSVLVQQIGCKILQHLNLLCQINTKPKANIETSNRSNLAAPCR